MPVTYMVTLALRAASNTSSSRIDPPGCTMARTPASMRISAPSANGKKASEAATGALRAVAPIIERIGAFHGQMRRIHAVHLSHADAYRRHIVGNQDRIGFDATNGAPCEFEILERTLVRGLTGNKLPSIRMVSRGINQIGGLYKQPSVDLLELVFGLGGFGNLEDAQVLLLGLEKCEGLGLIIGATMTSVKIERMYSAISSVTVALEAITPP